MKQFGKRWKRKPIIDHRINEFPAVMNSAGDVIYVLDEQGREITLDEFLRDQPIQELKQD